MHKIISPLKDILKSNSIILGAGDKQFTVVSTKPSKAETQCYDIMVDSPDHLFVLENGVVCSNSTVQIKKGTATAGGVGKELNRSVIRMVINGIKDLSDNGIDLDIDDESLHGRVLAREAAGFKPGTVVDRNVLRTLQEKGVKKVIVHSPIATISAEGIPAEAFGLDYNRMLPSVGDHVGLQASTALSEPMIQGSLCLAWYTPVRMADGSEKLIKDIKPGDMVMGADKEGNHFPVKVKNVFDQGLKDVNKYGFITRNLNEISVDSTEDHKYLVEETIEEDE